MPRVPRDLEIYPSLLMLKRGGDKRDFRKGGGGGETIYGAFISLQINLHSCLKDIVSIHARTKPIIHSLHQLKK